MTRRGWSANRSAYIDRVYHAYDNVLGKNQVDVIKGFARFIDAKTVEINGKKITPDHILIATGYNVSHPDILGTKYGINSDGFFKLDAMPKRLAIVGASYIAVEIAGVLNALDEETNLFVRKQAPLRTSDPMLVKTLVESDEHQRCHTCKLHQRQKRLLKKLIAA